MRYTYKVYTQSNLATALDKFCHTPIRLVIFVIPMILAIYLALCSEHLPAAEGVLDVVIGGLVVLAVILFFASFFLGILCDKCRLSEKLALWDIRRQAAGGKLPLRFWIIVILIVALLATPGVAALISRGQARQAADDYHEAMTALDGGHGPEVTGNKVVSFNQNENRYSTKYIPENLQAETPSDARYILRCTDGEEQYGIYENSFVVGFRRTCAAEIYDRETGEVLASQLFYGGTPPHQIDEDVTKAQYGSEPDEAEILAWVEAFFG